jgi:hypothetical protein
MNAPHQIAAPQTTRPTPAKMPNGVSNRIAEPQVASFPEFSRSKHVERPFKRCLSKHDSKVEIKLGNDFSIAVGINCNGADQAITWLVNSVPCKPQTGCSDEQQMHIDFLNSLSPDDNVDFPNEINATQTLEAKCQKVDVNEVAQ